VTPKLRIVFLVMLWLIVPGCASNRHSSVSPGFALTSRDFTELLGTLAKGWNEGNSKLAADCFTQDAIYSALPSPKVRKGRQELFNFFGGENGRPRPMTMQWHHIAFDEASQIGMGEYTFTYAIRTHGIVVVRVAEKKIANWREYEVESPLEWDQLVGPNRF
jgi:hypothetical protein